jgi:putative addiction module killer protein
MKAIKTTAQFDTWMASLKDRAAIARIRIRIDRRHWAIRASAAIWRCLRMKVDFGPGYRVYFTERPSGEIVVLLCGGSKKGQDADIAAIALAKRGLIMAIELKPTMCGISERRRYSPLPQPRSRMAIRRSSLWRWATCARARMSKVAADAGISRAGLYKALGEGGNPSLETLTAILRSFGMRLSVATAA